MQTNYLLDRKKKPIVTSTWGAGHLIRPLSSGGLQACIPGFCNCTLKDLGFCLGCNPVKECRFSGRRADLPVSQFLFKCTRKLSLWSPWGRWLEARQPFTVVTSHFPRMWKTTYIFPHDSFILCFSVSFSKSGQASSLFNQYSNDNSHDNRLGQWLSYLVQPTPKHGSSNSNFFSLYQKPIYQEKLHFLEVACRHAGKKNNRPTKFPLDESEDVFILE